jgi:Protein of unknown function (DUF3108)
LLLAFALSVMAHAVTLTGGWLRLPSTQKAVAPPPLMARLQPVPVKVTVAKAPRAVVVAAAPATLVSGAPAAWSVPDTVAEPVAVQESPAAPEIAAQTEPPKPEPVVVATAAPSTFMAEPALIKTLPRRGRIDYKFYVYFNNSLTDVARTVQTWEAIGNTYTLDSKSNPVGLARLAPIGAHAYHSSGQVTERGLTPQRYTSREVRRGVSNEAAAQFDWDKNQLLYGRAAEQKNAALPAGSQDFVSFMFQLSLAPPPRGRIQMPITNGRNFETYELDVLDEETLETPMGALRVLPVKRAAGPSADGITVYLATEFRHLPVRILHFNRDGSPGGEIIATSIRIE